MFLVDALLSPTVDLWELSGALAVVGLGLGLALVAVTASVLAIVPAERSGMAASTVNTSRELGGVLAVAILGAVITGGWSAILPRTSAGSASATTSSSSSSTPSRTAGCPRTRRLRCSRTPSWPPRR